MAEPRDDSSNEEEWPELTLMDLQYSEDSVESYTSIGSEDSAPSWTTISKSTEDPGEYDEEDPPEIEGGRLYNVIIGRWIIPNTGALNLQHVVYPYINCAGIITYRMQSVDEQGNFRPIPERGWRVSEADMQGGPRRLRNRLSYFEYDAAVTRLDPNDPVPDYRARIRALIQRHMHDTVVRAHREQHKEHERLRNFHFPTTPADIEAAARRRERRHAWRQAERQVNRRVERRIQRRLTRLEHLAKLHDINHWTRSVRRTKWNPDKHKSKNEDEDESENEKEKVEVDKDNEADSKDKEKGEKKDEKKEGDDGFNYYV